VQAHVEGTLVRLGTRQFLLDHGIAPDGLEKAERLARAGQTPMHVAVEPWPLVSSPWRYAETERTSRC
jgi:cation transport ATPase